MSSVGMLLSVLLVFAAASVDAMHDVPRVEPQTLVGDGGTISASPRLTAAKHCVDSEGLPPPDQDCRPYYDFVVAALVMGGGSKGAEEEIERVRAVYSRYESRIFPRNSNLASSQSNSSEVSSVAPLTLKLVFVVGREGLPESVAIPEAGILLGDFLHVDVREGYRFLGEKTKAMMGLSEHLR